MSENTGNKKKRPSSGKKNGRGNKSKHASDSAGKGGSGVDLKKKNKLAGRTVEMSSGAQIRIEDVMNESGNEMETAPKPKRPRPSPPVKTENEMEPETSVDEAGFTDKNVDYGEAEQINWKKQIGSIGIWMFSVILLSLTFFPGESLWNILHGIILGVLGFKAFLWAGLLIFFGYLMTKQIDEEQLLDIIRPVAGIILLIDVLSYILIQSDGYRNVYNELSFDIFPLFNQMLNDGAKVGGSGLLGGAIGELLILFAGKAGAAIITCILLTALIMVLTHTGPVDLFNQAKKIIRALLDPQFYKKMFEGETEETSYKTVFDDDESFYDDDVMDIDVEPEEELEDKTSDTDESGEMEAAPSDDAVQSDAEESLSEIVKAVSLKKKKKKLSKAEEIMAESDEISRQVESGAAAAGESEEKEYKFPTVRLLVAPKNTNSADDMNELTETAHKLIKTLDEYSVKASISDISRGPTVTRYEIDPAPGVKINKIKNLSNDIALRLAAQSIRIEAPIPGKAAVGIEIPNKNKQMVRIREILGSREFAEAKGSLTVALGKDIEGNIILCDLSKMPHLLIAGSTGSGKSVCVNSMLISLLYKYSPEDVRMVLIDPKSVEFDMYNGIPHLLVPVVCEPKKAAGALQWAVSEMLKRYSMLKEHGVRNIDGYNRLAEKSKEFDKLCRIVIVIDEMADLMIASPKEVEDAIARLAAMARAAGMYMVLATQRPSVDVITGTIKNNIPSRIALAVSSQIDSRTILDEGGAENLIGYGDMLYHPMGSSKHIRVQGCFVEDAEVDRVIRFVKQNGLAEYDDTIADEIERNSLENAGESSAEFEGKDEYFEKAVEVVTEAGQASTSMLQRRLGVGYARAGRIIDQLEEHGIIGPHEGSKPRAVLITRTQWLEMTMSRSHSGKNDPIVRSHSEFAAQTLDAGHEEITARQSEFFNAEIDDDELYDDNDDELADIPDSESDDSDEETDEELSEDINRAAETADDEENSEVVEVEFEYSEPDNDADNHASEVEIKDFTRFISEPKNKAPSASMPVEPTQSAESKKPKKAPVKSDPVKKKPIGPSSTPRDFSIFFDDDPDEMDDFFEFTKSDNTPAAEVSSSHNEPEDIPPWEDLPSVNHTNDNHEMAADKTGDDDDLHAFSEPDNITIPADVNRITNNSAKDEEDDDDMSDDILSSPWIKKL